jgi:hypothetical protein
MLTAAVLTFDIYPCSMCETRALRGTGAAYPTNANATPAADFALTTMPLS